MRRLRGRLNITELPVWVSMLIRITESVRMPVRPTPPSPPRSSRLTRSLEPQGSVFVMFVIFGAVTVCSLGATVLIRSRVTIA